MFSNLRAKRKGLLISTTVAACLIAVVGYLLMHRLQTNSVESIQHSIEAWRAPLTLVRRTVIGLVALGWHRLVAWLANVGHLHPKQAAQLAGLRWRIVLWLVVLELVLGQGVLVRTMSLALGRVV